jgi:hypothetical protein
MKSDKWGASTQNLYAQFLYRITKYQEINKNIKIGIYCPPLFLSGGSYKKFRERFFKQFGFEKGFLFESCHFSDVAKNWGISFTIFGNELNSNKFNLDIIDFNDSFELEAKDTKEIYNIDNENKLSEFTRKSLKGLKTFDAPQMSSSINIKQSGRGTVIDIVHYLGTFHTAGNATYKNITDVGLYTSCNSNSHSHSITINNFYNVICGFIARKSITPNWINCKDEYLAPNENHPEYEQFTYDSIVYSLFNNSSQQSSLRQVSYKDKLWDIKNEFFWISKKEIQQLANDSSYDEIYKDARTSDERFVYKQLFESGIYEKLSNDAKEVLDIATDLTKRSFEMRKLVSENNPEYHLDSWDAGYAQLKLVWKDYFKDEFKSFRDKYKSLEDRMRPLVYRLGFLKE